MKKENQKPNWNNPIRTNVFGTGYVLNILWMILKGVRLKTDIVDGETGEILLYEGRKMRRKDLKRMMGRKTWQRV